MEYILKVMDELLSDYFHSKIWTLGKTEYAIHKGQPRDTKHNKFKQYREQ